MWQREETASRTPAGETCLVSGYRFSSQRGGVQVGVQRTTEMPLSCSLSTSSSSQSSSNLPSSGSIRPQANSPTRSRRSPYSLHFSISLASSAGSHSSG